MNRPGKRRWDAPKRATLETAAYLAPEQLLGEGSNHRSDIYSLGVMLYELLTGGTPFSGEELSAKGFEEMRRIIQERYPVDDWNIYAAQASDGHNFDYDMPMTLSLLKEQILPLCQYYAYLQVDESEDHGNSVLWNGYSLIDQQHGHFARAAVTNPSEIYPVFHQLFERHSAG